MATMVVLTMLLAVLLTSPARAQSVKGRGTWMEWSGWGYARSEVEVKARIDGQGVATGRIAYTYFYFGGYEGNYYVTTELPVDYLLVDGGQAVVGNSLGGYFFQIVDSGKHAADPPDLISATRSGYLWYDPVPLDGDFTVRP